jgi:phosphoribosyl-ATP pyrophosphohydrolase/phosphoribosyl-AMP cyclohydrolase
MIDTEKVNLDFEKHADGLIPVIVQDSRTMKVLMLAYANDEALDKTESSGHVTFYSRSKRRLWTKGETSGNFLTVDEIMIDCDRDTILIKATPAGPVCHTGSDTCFGEANEDRDFLFTLEGVIKDRRTNPQDDSYTSRLFAKGVDKIAQKVGEEAVELVIEAKNSDADRLRAEAADLMYHLLVLLTEKGVELSSVVTELERRARPLE